VPVGDLQNRKSSIRLNPNKRWRGGPSQEVTRPGDAKKAGIVLFVSKGLVAEDWQRDAVDVPMQKLGTCW